MRNTNISIRETSSKSESKKAINLEENYLTASVWIPVGFLQPLL